MTVRASHLRFYIIGALVVVAVAVGGFIAVSATQSNFPQPALADEELPACVLDDVVNAPSDPQLGALLYCSSAVSVSGVGGGSSGLPRTVPVEPNTVWISGAPDALACLDQTIADHHQRTGVSDLGIAEAASTCGVLIEHYLPSGEMMRGNTEFSDAHKDPYLNPATGGMADDGTLTDVITPE